MTTPRYLSCSLALAGALVVASSRAWADAPPPTPTPPAVAHSIVVHVAPIVGEVGTPIELAAMIDAPFAETLSVRWRALGAPTWQDVMFERSSAGGWYAKLPAASPPGVEYYIRGQDANGAEVMHFASQAAPHVVRIDPTELDRLEALDRARVFDHANQVSVDVIAHNFGNRYDIPDEFIRTELAYTHRLFRRLHQVVFGFGTIDGKTPLAEAGIDGGHEYHALRYGFGEVRLRLHRSLFVDLRVSLGASHAGFDQGVRGAITFGKPWRSALTVGGEYLGDLGPTAWVRLQWDTAAPFLMGASIVRTDLPGALVARSGLYIGYDVALPVADRVTVRAQLSYGSRDGAAHFGGGLGMAVDF